MTENNSTDKDWDILSTAFDDLDFPNRIFIHMDDFRKHLWKKYKINKPRLQEMLTRLYQTEYCKRIRLFGGPGYTKTNWIMAKTRMCWHPEDVIR